jgi:protein phosphatase
VIRFEQIEHASLSDVGVRRSHNQDNHAFQLAHDEAAWQQCGHLFLVADGMGAHAVGEKASEQAALAIPHIYQKYAPQGPVVALRKSFTEANASIHACGQQNREFEGMGTTCTALVVRPEGAWVGHVGDSRAYRIRGGLIEQLSYDHSLVWEYARLKRIDPDDVQDIPSNVIHRCLGPEPAVKVDVEGPYPLHPGDTFLLCSDGLSGQLSDMEIGAIVSVLPPAEASQLLIDLANLRGGPDNITVLIIRIPDGTLGNGVPAPPPARPLDRPRPAFPWWLAALLAGTAVAGGAAVLAKTKQPGALGVFLLAAGLIIAGLVGLLQHYRTEQTQNLKEDDDTPRPRIHRRAACRIEQPLVERLAKAVRTLSQRAEERNWAPDWTSVRQHEEEAAHLLEKKDLPGAFRAYCRAILPLTSAFSKQRNKEESFQPVWDKAKN